MDGMGWLQGSQQDVRVDENGHLPAVWIEALAADRCIRKRRGNRVALRPFHEFSGLVPRIGARGRTCIAGSAPLGRQIAFPPRLHTGKDQLIDRLEVSVTQFFADNTLRFGLDVDRNGSSPSPA